MGITAWPPEPLGLLIQLQPYTGIIMGITAWPPADMSLMPNDWLAMKLSYEAVKLTCTIYDLEAPFLSVEYKMRREANLLATPSPDGEGLPQV